MAKIPKLIILLVIFIVVSVFSIAHAFNPATHLYIAQGVFRVQDKDLNYGSIAPDMALYTHQEKWPTSFEDTHYNYIDLMKYAFGSTQKAFARG